MISTFFRAFEVGVSVPTLGLGAVALLCLAILAVGALALRIQRFLVSAALLLFVTGASAEPPQLIERWIEEREGLSNGEERAWAVDVAPEAVHLLPTLPEPETPALELTISLPDQPRRVARLVRSVEHSALHYSWIGELAPGQSVVATATPDALNLTVFSGKEVYVVTPSRDRNGQFSHRLVKLTARGGITDEVDVPSGRLTQGSSSVPDLVAKHEAASLIGKSTSSVAYIDILVFFSQNVAIATGWTSIEMRNYAHQQVEMLNTVLQNSGVTNLVARLAHSQLSGRIDATNPYNSAADLTGLQADTLLYPIRDAFYADVVVQIGEVSNVDGRAFGNNDPNNHADKAYAVVYRQGNTGGITFAHEIGHELGMDHLLADSSPTPLYPWAHAFVGYVTSPYTTGFVTTLTTVGQCGGSPPCYQIPYFSNPNIVIAADPIQGRAIGDPATANNSLVATAVGPIVATYRVPPPPLFADGFE